MVPGPVDPEDGSLDVAGAVYAGTPGVYFGRNRKLAWGFTNHVASVRDLYVERVDPARPDGYLEGDDWRPFEVERETIAVRGEADVTLEMRRTVRGPLVDDLLPALDPPGSPPGPGISLRWAGLELGSGLEALLALNAAGASPRGRRPSPAGSAPWPTPSWRTPEAGSPTTPSVASPAGT